MTSLSGELCCEALESTTALGFFSFLLGFIVTKKHEVVSPSVTFFSFREGTCLTMFVLY